MPSRVPGSCEEPRERVAALGRDGHGARAPHAKDPAVLEVHLEERRAERAADVRPPLREVDAGARESAPLVESRLDVDAERRQPLLAKRGQAEIALIGGEPARFQQGGAEIRSAPPWRAPAGAVRAAAASR